jgi:Zn-dependent peptidase ImmA (M78 family)
MSEPPELSAAEVGRRLRLARENAGVNQEEAAMVIKLSRPTLVSIEKGTRRIRVEELQSLASHYGTSVNALLRREAVHTDLIPRFRKLQDAEDNHTMEAARLLNDLVKAEVELENVLGIARRKNYPPERSIDTGDVLELAEQHAQELRDWLGLGSGPIADIFTTMEIDIGIRLYQRRLSSASKVAGLFTFDDQVGACILLNANHPLERRIQTGTHELGHLVGTRRSPEVLEDGGPFLSREERYASAFARAFLTPRDSFGKNFESLKAGKDRVTRPLVIMLAHQYHISREACVRRLEELDLVKKGTWDWFKANGGITDKHAFEVLGDAAIRRDPAKDESVRPVSYRICLMAHAAWKRELRSEGQLAELLKISRVRLREIIDQIELEESETDDVLKFPRR